MPIPELDYYTIFQEEGEPFYDEIYTLKRNDFNTWVSERFVEINEINTFEEVAPSQELLIHFINSGYYHLNSQCHYSAKAINLINPEFEYWTGFIKRQDYINPIITHSFNIYKNRIYDFARINEKHQVLKTDTPYFPHVYFGVKVPNEIVKNLEQLTFEENSMSPLLYELFIEETK